MNHILRALVGVRRRLLVTAADDGRGRGDDGPGGRVRREDRSGQIRWGPVKVGVDRK